ncbi:MAG TPA: flagellar hook-associated protein FlgK [Epulopiscium sp.]|nr:flagellar hook-associated protein FlgK [Candidatus Epulonipiscium sp.]
MSSIASLGRVVSGLNASQRGLQVTSHNITNANTPGYIRQQLLQHDSKYLNIGSGVQKLQVGIGVSMSEIRQIRDEFADRRYRTENSVLSYYVVKKDAIDELETIFGEPHGEALSKSINDFWSQTQKLATNPSGIEERMAFIQSADVFAKQANHIQDQLTEYQNNLDIQIRDTVKNVNNLIKDVQSLNESIAFYEINGDNANDLRDRRNFFLDELSSIMEIQYREEKDGRVIVTSEGITLIDKQFRAEMTTAQAAPKSSFVKPVWKDQGTDVYRMDRAATSISGRDNGKLKALLMMRGNGPANAGTPWDDITMNDNLSIDSDANAFLIPKIQKEFDIFIKTLADTINGVFNPDTDQPWGQGVGATTQGTELFLAIRPTLPEILGDPIDPTAGMGAGNIQINPLLLESGGYNYLPTSLTGDESDTQVIETLLGKWNEGRDWFDDPEDAVDSSPIKKNATFRAFYSELIAELGAEGSEATGRAEEKVILIRDIDNGRQSMGGVSTDEEMTNMMKYQYSYNAAARMVTVLDGMMDTIINRMGA